MDYSFPPEDATVCAASYISARVTALLCAFIAAREAAGEQPANAVTLLETAENTEKAIAMKATALQLQQGDVALRAALFDFEEQKSIPGNPDMLHAMAEEEMRLTGRLQKFPLAIAPGRFTEADKMPLEELLVRYVREDCIFQYIALRAAQEKAGAPRATLDNALAEMHGAQKQALSRLLHGWVALGQENCDNEGERTFRIAFGEQRGEKEGERIFRNVIEEEYALLRQKQNDPNEYRKRTLHYLPLVQAKAERENVRENMPASLWTGIIKKEQEAPRDKKGWSL